MADWEDRGFSALRCCIAALCRPVGMIWVVVRKIRGFSALGWCLAVPCRPTGVICMFGREIRDFLSWSGV